MKEQEKINFLNKKLQMLIEKYKKINDLFFECIEMNFKGVVRVVMALEDLHFEMQQENEKMEKQINDIVFKDGYDTTLQRLADQLQAEIIEKEHICNKYKKLQEENEKLNEKNKRLIRIEKEYNAHCEYLNSIEGVDLIYENKRLQDRVKELENACCEEAVKKNIALNAYEMTRTKLKDIFIKPEFINDICYTGMQKRKNKFLIIIGLPWEKVKGELPEKAVKGYEIEEVREKQNATL